MLVEFDFNIYYYWAVKQIITAWKIASFLIDWR